MEPETIQQPGKSTPAPSGEPDLMTSRSYQINILLKLSHDIYMSFPQHIRPLSFAEMDKMLRDSCALRFSPAVRFEFEKTWTKLRDANQDNFTLLLQAAGGHHQIEFLPEMCESSRLGREGFFAASKLGLCGYCHKSFDEPQHLTICGRCDQVYCDTNCQRRDWEKHRFICGTQLDAEMWHVLKRSGLYEVTKRYIESLEEHILFACPHEKQVENVQSMLKMAPVQIEWITPLDSRLSDTEFLDRTTNEQVRFCNEVATRFMMRQAGLVFPQRDEDEASEYDSDSTNPGSEYEIDKDDIEGSDEDAPSRSRPAEMAEVEKITRPPLIQRQRKPVIVNANGWTGESLLHQFLLIKRGLGAEAQSRFTRNMEETDCLIKNHPREGIPEIFHDTIMLQSMPDREPQPQPQTQNERDAQFIKWVLAGIHLRCAILGHPRASVSIATVLTLHTHFLGATSFLVQSMLNTSQPTSGDKKDEYNELAAYVATDLFEYLLSRPSFIDALCFPARSAIPARQLPVWEHIYWLELYTRFARSCLVRAEQAPSHSKRIGQAGFLRAYLDAYGFGNFITHNMPRALGAVRDAVMSNTSESFDGVAALAALSFNSIRGIHSYRFDTEKAILAHLKAVTPQSLSAAIVLGDYYECGTGLQKDTNMPFCCEKCNFRGRPRLLHWDIARLLLQEQARDSDSVKITPS